MNGGTCYPFGATGFYCACPSGCTGTNCASCSNPSIQCIDYNSAVCKYYASIGACTTNSYINTTPIRTYCALTCNSCTIPVPSPTCVDSYDSCIYWSGNCNRLANPSMCSKTCKLC